MADIEQITPLVEQILNISDITLGDPQKKYLVRYRGTLKSDSVSAYPILDEAFQPLNLTPLFRLEGGQHVVIVTEGRVSSKPANPWVNLVMFLITFFSVIFTGAIAVYQPKPTDDFMDMIFGALTDLRSGLPFALSLMAILLAHEFGHYFVGRIHKAPVTLPYFIPLPAPISPFGTMGAVIQMKASPRNRRSLLDIGIAGPLAGFIFSVPILIYGLSLSTISVLERVPGAAIQMEGNSLLYLFIKWSVFQQVLPAPASFGSLPPFVYWIIYFFTGKPFPWGGVDVMIDPIAFAGWAGLLVTALNLLPVGQLDGGHILYALFGPRVKKLFPFIIGITVLLGFAWPGWWLWTALLFLFGRMYDEPLDQITTLDARRKVLGVLGLVLFVLVFTPVPLIITAP
jgi:membrane-associated protease RseP (regulator of RpoE activity)